MKFRIAVTTGVTSLVLAGLALSTAAQQAPSSPALDAATRTAVVEGAIEHMVRAYIFEDVAHKMAAALRTRAGDGAYDAITDPKAFAQTLTQDLQAVSRDKHLRIIYDPKGLPQRAGGPTPEERARQLAAERGRNFGFLKVEILDGNVGYIDLRGFSGTPEARGAAVAAMNFVADTGALIFDLRRNGGGSPFMIGILSSYLFDEVVHLNIFEIRETNTKRDFHTSADVEGRRYGKDKPVYVLVSNATFSAAEEFTYNLKNLKRATIVGETTGGGAHPGGVRRITDHFGIWLPNGRAINPITQTNWEGTGIEPDIKVPASEALDAALRHAKERVR